MLKIRRVYICNKCGQVALPKIVTRSDDNGYIFKVRLLPNGWSRPFGFNKHLCPECTHDLRIYLNFEKNDKEDE